VGVTVLGVDGGNTKTDLVAATVDGTLLAHVRGPGSNSHGPAGAEGCIAVVASLVEQAGLHEPARHGAFFLCGADVPDDIAALEAVLKTQPWVHSSTVDNDTFALLHSAGGDDAIAVICGGGVNCVGRRADGRISRYPSLGWETGDWGGAEGLGREALHQAARAEDGRGPDTALVDIVREHFGLPSVLAVAEAVHYRRLKETRLGELAPLVVAVAGDDTVAAVLVERLTTELLLLVRRAASDLDLSEFDVVLGGGMLAGDASYREVFVARLGQELPRARPIVPDVPPVVGAVLVALGVAGASPVAASTLRAAFGG
jgi:N-acetylglucosamine kinase-like BadF-type ATPase